MEAKQRELNFAELMKESAAELQDYEERADSAEAESVEVQKKIDKLEGFIFLFNLELFN